MVARLTGFDLFQMRRGGCFLVASASAAAAASVGGRQVLFSSK
jgi:hypothetical protein